MAVKRDPKIDQDTVRLRGWIDLAVGLALFAIGAIVFAASHSDATHASTSELASYVALMAGGLTAVRGMWRLLRSPMSGTALVGFKLRGGYKSFIAWRYLLVGVRKVTRGTQGLLALGIALQIVLRMWLWFAHSDLQVLLLVIVAWLAFLFTCAVMVWGVLRHYKAALITFLIGFVLNLFGWVGFWLVQNNKLLIVHVDSERRATVLLVLFIIAVIGGALAGLAMYFGFLRAFFTFFTVVSIGGLWIGTAALVMVLAVMSGFESDLREKILGSKAHLQITREDGDFVEWRDVKARLDQMPGVVASTPYAESEVVVAANNTGMNVIIKGIDPKTVGKVTDLVTDLEDHEAMKRLDPIIGDSPDLRVPQHPRTGTGTIVDPPPDDMPTPGDPIDFSGAALGSGSATGSGSAGSDSGSTEPGMGPPLASGSAGIGSGALLEGAQPFGGDAKRLLDAENEFANDPVDLRAPRPALDPPPPDLITSDEPPADYSRPDYLQDVVVKAIDSPFDTPSLSRRTQALPGILVGRELVKQTHLYTGEEVRIVSPLSDPSNPDATGTPIPFNRDYRVAGIFFTGMYEYDLKYVYVTLDSLQGFLDRGDAIDGIEVRVNNPDDTDLFVSKFQATFGPHYRVQDWKELNRSLFSALKLEKIAMFLVLGIVILVASFSIIGNLIMVVVEKAREIALLKTLGASDVGVMQLFAIQGLMIGLIGTTLGVATGLLGCWAGKRYGIPVSPDVYYIDRLPIHVDPMSVLAAASAGILISILATLYPAVVAAQIRPAAGMRH